MASDRRPSSLRILQVLEPSGGGSGRHFIDLCGYLKKKGHDVTAIYSPARAESRFVGELEALQLSSVQKIHMERAVGLSDVAALIKIYRFIRNNGPFDIVHAHSSKAGALTRVRFAGRYPKRVYTPHAFRTLDPALGRKGKLLFGMIESVLGRYFSEMVLCVSDSEREHAHSLGIPAKKVRTVVNGVESAPNGRREELRASWNVRPEEVLFGYVGRLSKQKAPDRLIQAFNQAASHFPNARLLMIGSGELEGEVKSMISSSPFNNRIDLISGVDGFEAMQAFDVLVMSSRYEAMSYVALEAEAAGRPMILTNVSGAEVVLDHEINGFLVPNTDDIEPLSKALLEFSSQAVLSQMTAAAEARKDFHSLEKMAEEIENIYFELI